MSYEDRRGVGDQSKLRRVLPQKFFGAFAINAKRERPGDGQTESDFAVAENVGRVEIRHEFADEPSVGDERNEREREHRRQEHEGRHAGPRGRDQERAADGEQEDDRGPERTGPRVVRTRTRAVKPMSLDDALLTLSGGPQNFLVFRNAESDGVAILYRRPDGDYGLIEPEG